MDNFHPIPAESGPKRAAEQYADLLDKTGRLDIVVLGMGEDGHTASLFPDNDALNDQHSAVAVYGAPKPPGERVSIGLVALKNAGDPKQILGRRGQRLQRRHQAVLVQSNRMKTA